MYRKILIPALFLLGGIVLAGVSSATRSWFSKITKGKLFNENKE